MIRAGAAMIVVANHLRGLFFVPWARVQSHDLVNRAGYFVTSLGHQAVMVFFVLSGYLVGSSVLRADFSRWSWRWYLNRRLTRLWIVLIPAIVLCALLDHLGILLFGVAGIYTHGQNTAGIISGSVQRRDTLAIALGNITFLQTIRVPTFGSDTALWSLANEFWYYLLFPMALIVIKAKAIVTKLLAAVVGCGIFLLIGQTITLYFAIWLFGAAIAILPSFNPLRNRAVWRG